MKKGEKGGFALRRLGEIPPFYKGGMLFMDKPLVFGTRKCLAGSFSAKEVVERVYAEGGMPSMLRAIRERSAKA